MTPAPEVQASRYRDRLLASPLPWLLLAVAWTWPTALHPITAAPGSAHTDLWESLWTLWFVATRLASGELPIHTGTLLDQNGSLWPSDPLGALLVMPITLTAGPAAAWSTLVIVSMTLRGWIGARIGALYAGSAAGPGVSDFSPLQNRTSKSQNLSAGWLTGAMLALAPMALSAIHNGASEALGDVWVLGVVWMGLRGPSGEPGGPSGEWSKVGAAWVIGAGLLLAVSAWAHWYGGVGAFCAWGVLAARRGLSSKVRRAFVLAGILGVLGALPVAWEARSISTARDNVVGIKAPPELARLRRNIGPADPAAFVRPAPFRSPDFTKISRYGEDYWHSPYLGWVGIGLSLVSLLSLRPPSGAQRKVSRWAWALIPIGVVLAIGPVLTAGGSVVVLSGRRAVPLPYFLFEQLPPFNSLSLLWKLGWVAQIGVALCAAQGVTAISSWVKSRVGSGRWVAYAGALLVLVEAALVAPTRGLPDHVDASARAPLVALAQEPTGTVMVWPLIGGLPTLYEQVTHGKTVAASLNFPSSRGAAQVVNAVRSGRESTIAVARRVGIRYVVLHLDAPTSADESKLSASDWEHFPILAEDGKLRVLKLW